MKTLTLTRRVQIVDKDCIPNDAKFLESAYSYTDKVMYEYYIYDSYYGVEYFAVPRTFEDLWADAED